MALIQWSQNNGTCRVAGYFVNAPSKAIQCSYVNVLLKTKVIILLLQVVQESVYIPDVDSNYCRFLNFREPFIVRVLRSSLESRK